MRVARSVGGSDGEEGFAVFDGFDSCRENLMTRFVDILNCGVWYRYSVEQDRLADMVGVMAQKGYCTLVLPIGEWDNGKVIPYV